MRKSKRLFQIAPVLIVGLLAISVSLLVTVQMATASGVQQDDEPEPDSQEDASALGDQVPYTAEECQECHLDITEHWASSPHANAFSDPVFQQRWSGMGEPPECLSCHTTSFNPASGEYDAEGISCQACHGEVAKDHPSAPVPILADTQYCGSCHTTTLSEWHRTGHATHQIGCNACHDPHSQQPLFVDSDELCINCHEDTMGEYLEGIHDQKGIGCVDCHALVIPPDPAPDDGIVPTGHAFTITPATCVACHTDALHAGFSLPGYEQGAKNGPASEVSDQTIVEAPPDEESETVEPSDLSPEQQIQALEAALASRNVTLLFQGAIVGLVLGGSTAWIVANNVRSRQKEEENNDDEEG
ncbi:MAG: multiheme c-type cytochrome [Candidatus Promineifilaceae bacterium]